MLCTGQIHPAGVINAFDFAGECLANMLLTLPADEKKPPQIGAACYRNVTLCELQKGGRMLGFVLQPCYLLMKYLENYLLNNISNLFYRHE